MIRILILTRRFEYGGAERQLVYLVKGLDKTRFSITVSPFYEGGPLLQEMERVPDVQVVPLHKKGRWDLVPFFWRLWRTVAREKPHIVYGYMGVANQLALIVGKLAGAKVVWGIRASNMDLDRYDWLTRMLYRLECWGARWPDLIISNSLSGKDYHHGRGFPGDKIVVIPNGIDTDRFAPDPILRDKLRAEWGLTDKNALIGLVARLDAMKDHPTFLRAAAFFRREWPHVRFVCVGDGTESYREQLRALSRELGLADCIRWVGFRDDIEAVYSSLDLACSSSLFGEGFSNAIGEAMACAVPCVVTDVGDSAAIVGTTGEVAPGGDSQALANGWKRLLARLQIQPGLRAEARNRITQHFGIASLVERTSAAFHSVLS